MHNTIYVFLYFCDCCCWSYLCLRCFDISCTHCVCRLPSVCRWIAIQRITNGGNAIMTGRRAFRLGNDGPCVCVCVWLCLMRFFNLPDYLSACAGGLTEAAHTRRRWAESVWCGETRSASFTEALGMCVGTQLCRGQEWLLLDNMHYSHYAHNSAS